MKKNKIIVGNWKMNPISIARAREIFTGIEKGLTKIKSKKIEVIICPSHLHIASLATKAKGNVNVGAQNAFVEPKGAFTGEISFEMLKDAGISHIIVGHSDRRKLGETDDMINKKVLLALKTGIVPIVCIGETVRDEEGSYLGLIKEQLASALRGVTKTQLGSIVIAYEPVWAIGALEAMNAHDIHQTMLFVRKALMDQYKMKAIGATPIIYGGAVDPTNAQGILTEGQVDGMLIGRQSLDPKSFLEIIGFAENL